MYKLRQKKSFHIALAILVPLLAVTVPAEEPSLAEPYLLKPSLSEPSLSDMGAQILLPFKHQLQQALKAGMADSPVAAVNICHLQAPVIAQSFSTKNIRVGRSSHKLRNPDYAPAPWMSGVINNYLDVPEDQQAVALRLEDGRIGYAEPILTRAVCLTCHGENIAPKVKAQLAELYPDDRATGFHVGELRGIFWAEFAID
jgi:hypothetical protein